MYFAVPNLAYLAILFSCYNALSWTIDWVRFNIGYFGSSFFALIPQALVTLFLLLMVRNYNVYSYRVTAPFVISSLWFCTLVIGGADLFFPDEPLPWSFTFSVLESLGFPILELHFDGVAPLLGLFHNNQGDIDARTDWYFDGGVQFTWLLFNIVTLLLLVATIKVAYEDFREGNKPQRGTLN